MFFNAYSRAGCRFLSRPTYLQPWRRSSSNSTSTSSINTSKPKPPPPILGPSQDYLAASRLPCPPHDRNIDTSRKLIVLDLNGVIVYRTVNRDVQRPYWRAFRSYLFHHRTREWLDTMMWSSTKPTDVGKIVTARFGHTKKLLVGVWARHKMTLDPQASSQGKSNRLKDLHNVWENKMKNKHSSYTTLLVDYSYDRTRLQPYNHLAIPKYDGKSWAQDLSVYQKSRQQEALEKYDDTLLCAVGILEAMKGQENVAHWIQQGGLRAGRENPWWEIPAVREHWRRRGMTVLDDMKITIDPGVFYQKL